MPIEYLIGMAASIIIASVKNPQHKVALKAIMLKIFNTIRNSYTGDPDFN